MRPLISMLLAAQLLVTAQEPAPKGTVKFETTSQLVVINVSAKSKTGAPVEGLKASDFTVTEDGKTQQLKVFEFQRLEDTALPQPPPTARAAVVEKPVTAATIAPSKPGEIKYKDR